MKNILSTVNLKKMPDCVQTYTYDRKNTATGIMHIGAGAFFKSHQAVYTDTALAMAGGDWGICAVSPNSPTAKETLGLQDGLYTLKLLSDPAKYRVIGAIKEVLAGPDDRNIAIERIADPKIRIITMTVTEKGYCLNADGKLDFSHSDIASDLEGHNLQKVHSPKTAIGILVAGLALRSRADATSLAIISCDNISGNGTKLGNAVIDFAQKKDTKLASWIQKYVCFPNTMVDSITPASDATLKQSVLEATGLVDNASVHREKFTDWVIEDFDSPRPAWDKAGAIFTSDVKPYENAKLRLVNAPHSALTYLGLLRGHQSVAEAMDDNKIANFFYRLTEDELIPSLGDHSPINLREYRDRIGMRFANKSVHHELFQIATDGSAKIQQRFLPPLAINREQGALTKCLSLGIASWMFYVMQCARKKSELNDPLKAKICEIASFNSAPSMDDVDRLLILKEVFPSWVNDDQLVKTGIHEAYDDLRRNDVSCALDKAIKDVAETKYKKVVSNDN